SEASDGSDSGLAETGSNATIPAALAALALALGGIALWIAGRRRTHR
ncbi:MAG: LPXTG cell wall anchor domain-containing protein, partial [Brachybacterium tyrofermentans]